MIVPITQPHLTPYATLYAALEHYGKRKHFTIGELLFDCHIPTKLYSIYHTAILNMITAGILTKCGGSNGKTEYHVTSYAI